MRLQEHIDKQPLDRRRIVADLVIPRRLTTAQLQPVQRRFPRQWRAIRPLGLQLARQNRQHRIMSEFIVIIEVLIAQRDANDPLRHQRGNLVLDQLRRPCIGEATRKPLGQPDRPVGLSQQQCARIRGNRSTIETGHHLPSCNRCKFKQRWVTLRRHRGAPLLSSKSLSQKNFRHSEPRCTYSV